MNIIAAMFLYKDDLNGVDIEFTKRSSHNPGYNSQYVIHPLDNPGNIVRFLMELDGINTTQYFDWQPSKIKPKSIHGYYEQPSDSSYIIYEWQYFGDDNTLEERNLKIHINFWLYQGKPPQMEKKHKL